MSSQQAFFGCPHSFMMPRPCAMCQQSAFCPTFWKTQKIKLPDRKDRKYWPGNPDPKYHRR